MAHAPSSSVLPMFVWFVVVFQQDHDLVALFVGDDEEQSDHERDDTCNTTHSTRGCCRMQRTGGHGGMFLQ